MINCCNFLLFFSGKKACKRSSPRLWYLSNPYHPLKTSLILTSNFKLISGKVVCKEGYIRCNASKKCIPSDWQCDGEENCPDGEDEKGKFSTICDLKV